MHYVAGETIYAQDDRPATAAEGITLTQFRARAPTGDANGNLTVFAGVADTTGGGREILTQIDITPSSTYPASRNRVSRLSYNRYQCDWSAMIGALR